MVYPKVQQEIPQNIIFKQILCVCVCVCVCVRVCVRTRTRVQLF